jgi:hypothetical protein
MNPTDDKRGSFIIVVYCELFEHYMYLGEYILADESITKALHLSIEQENFYYQNDVLKKMFLLYEQKGDEEKINSLFPYIKSILTNHTEKINNGNIIFTYLIHYLETNECSENSVMCKELLNLIRRGVVIEKN